MRPDAQNTMTRRPVPMGAVGAQAEGRRLYGLLLYGSLCGDFHMTP